MSAIEINAGDAGSRIETAEDRLKASHRASKVLAYRTARDLYLAAADRADASFVRYFNRLQAGERTNAAQASRLANEANYLSADLASAQAGLFALEIDPASIDRADGIAPLEI